MILFPPITDYLLWVETVVGICYRELPLEASAANAFHNISVSLFDGTCDTLYHITYEIEVIVCYLFVRKVDIAHGMSLIS